MFRLLRDKCLTALSAFVLLFQLFAPTLAAANGVPASLICSPSGHISVEMQAALDELKDVLGFEDEDDDVMDCEDCVPAAYAVPAASAKAIASVKWVQRFVTPCSDKFTLASPRGPPLGSRAPPSGL